MRYTVLAMLICSPCLAAPPKVPTAPVVCTAGGQPQVVTIEVPPGTEFQAAPAFAPEDCLWFPGETDKAGIKKYLVMPYKAGVYRVTMWTKGELEYSTLVIDASGIRPGPTPGPGPGPGPGPIPVPSSGLKKISQEGLAKVTDKAYTIELARQIRALASKVAAGGYPNNASILAAYKATFNTVPPLDQLETYKASWKPWYDAVIGELGKQYAAGTLKDNASWAAAFNDIAEGLGG